MAVPLRSWAARVESGGPVWSVYREFRAAPTVAAAVACTWCGRGGWSRELRLLPDGCVDLVWDGLGLTVVSAAGAALRSWLPDGAETVGLRLRCGAAGSVLGVDMSTLPVGAVALADLWGEPARRAEDALFGAPSGQRRQVLESLVAARLGTGSAPSVPLLAAVRELRRPGGRGATAADRVGLSERGLRRRLRQEVGLGPKELQRVLRFRGFLRRLPALAQGRTSLAVAAADLGYADQSHLGRECRRLADDTPAALVGGWARSERLAETFQTEGVVLPQDRRGVPMEAEERP